MNPIFVHLKSISGQIGRATLYSIVENGLPVVSDGLASGHLTKSMNLYFHSFEIYFWANTTGYRAIIVHHCSKRATDGLLTGYLLCKTGYLLKSMNLYFHSYEVHLWAKSTGYRATMYSFVQNGLLTGYLLTSMNLYFHSFEIHLWTNWIDYRATMYSFVQNGLLTGYLLRNTGYPRATF